MDDGDITDEFLKVVFEVMVNHISQTYSRDSKVVEFQHPQELLSGSEGKTGSKSIGISEQGHCQCFTDADTPVSIDGFVNYLLTRDNK